MATFIGYNTIDQYRDYTLTDFALIKRDLLNAFNIRQGEKPGRPEVGTTIWNLLYEPQTPETKKLIEDEVNRVVSKDPRIFVASTRVFTQENGFLIELEVQTVGNAGVEQLSVIFDQTLETASYV